MNPGSAFSGSDTRPAGHIFLIPPDARPGDDPKTRPHFLVNRCDPREDPHGLGTLAHMSTKATEIVAYGSPGHRLASVQPASGDSVVVASRLLPQRLDVLVRSMYSAVGDVRSVRRSVLQAIGLGEGLAEPESGSVRGRLVRIVEPGLGFSFGFVLTSHRYSAQRRYQVVVPLLDRVVTGDDGPEELDVLAWDVLPERRAWFSGLHLAEPLLDTASLITLTEGWRESRNPYAWLRMQIEVTALTIDPVTLAAVEANIQERLER